VHGSPTHPGIVLVEHATGSARHLRENQPHANGSFQTSDNDFVEQFFQSVTGSRNTRHYIERHSTHASSSLGNFHEQLG
jgi:hypothetical protein